MYLDSGEEKKTPLPRALAQCDKADINKASNKKKKD